MAISEAAEPLDLPRSNLVPLHGAPLLLLTIAVATATFMEVLDTTIVNVSVPSIAGSLGVSPSEGTWAISSYMLAAAVVQPLTGWIGRRFGEVRSFLLSIALFMVFSALCGFATSMPMLVTCRLIQGFVSGPMMSLAQTMLLRSYPPERRGMALGLWGMVIISAPVMGPIIGGWITDNLSWPWLFYINVPIGMIALIIIASLTRGQESEIVKAPIDSVGLILLIFSVGCLQFILDNGNDMDWFGSPVIVANAVVALISFAFFIPWELTDRHPIVDLRLFRRRNFVVGVLCVSMAFFGFMGTTIIFPLWLQTTLGYTSTWSGLTVAPVGVLAIILSPIVGRYMHDLNLRVAVSISFAIFSATMFWMSTLNSTASFWQLAAPRFFQGVGLSFFFLPLNQILLTPIAPNEIASASGLSNFVRTMSGSLTTAISVWLWNRRSDVHHALLSEHVHNASGSWERYRSQLDSLSISGVHALGYTDRVIAEQASTIGVNEYFWLIGVIFIVLLPLVWLARPPFNARGADAAH